MQEVKKLEEQAKQVATETGFIIGREMYRGTYYSKNYIRNLIYEGIFKGQSAVLKIYDDPRQTDEPASLAAFHKYNNSQILTAPKLYASAITSLHTGWMIVEKLPPGKFFETPLSAGDRKEFLQVFVEYRKNFPTSPTRELTVQENLSAAAFTAARFKAWEKIATDKGFVFTTQDQKSLQAVQEFVLSRVNGLPMIWSHGHFKPHEIYKTDTGKYYLIDFAHTHSFPQGYEFGFMMWADQLMTIDGGTRFEELQAAVMSWQTDFASIAEQLGWKNFHQLARISISERLYGTVLADIAGSDQELSVKRQKIELLWKLAEWLMV